VRPHHQFPGVKPAVSGLVRSTERHLGVERNVAALDMRGQRRTGHGTDGDAESLWFAMVNEAVPCPLISPGPPEGPGKISLAD
jgi:hypothetical protein